ncbi:MAG: hypothetical protein SP1CHLAM54_07510 [Chlamydiia bacterium]|nr:hypothetical protein [Chlamydiia bacterium]MCH9615657.1 hypothetical protein [Chlamydiia bacterium]MCH9628940.1 hypothetical protein [Chlamydiia bacterium]
MRYLFGFLILIFLAVFSLPYALSTETGTKLLCRILSNKSTTVEVDDLSMGWFDMQKLEGLKVQTKSFDLRIDSLTSHHSLFEILFKGGDLGKTMIRRPRLVLKDSKSKRVPVILPHAGDVFIEDGMIRNEEIVFDDVNVQLGIPPNHSIVAIKAKGKTSDAGIEGSFDVDATVYPTLNETSKVNIKLRSLPTPVIDKVVDLFDERYGDFVSKAFGSTLSSDANIEFGLSKFNGTIDIKSHRMNGSLKAFYDEGGISFSKDSSLSFLIHPDFLQMMNVPYEEDISSTIVINKLHLPYEKGRVAFHHALADIALHSDQFSLEMRTKNLEKSLILFLKSRELQGEFKIVTPLETPRIKRAEAKAQHFPLYLLNDFGNFVGVFGKTLSGTLNYQTGLYTLSLNTPLLTLDNAKLTYIKDVITLKNTPSFAYRKFKGQVQEFKGTLSQFKAKLSSLTFGEATLKNIEVNYKAPDLKLSADGHTGKVLLDFNLMTRKSDLSLKDFSSYTVGSFLGAGQDFPSLIGPQLNLNLSHQEGIFDLNASSDNLFVDGKLREVSSGNYAGGPLEFEWTLSDQSYHALARFLDKPAHDVIKIKQPTKLKVNVHDISFPFPLENIWDVKVRADLKLDDLYLEPDYRLANVKGSISKEDLTKFTLQGDAKSKWHTGSFKFEGAQAKSFRIKGNVDNLPSIFLDILPISVNLSRILGDRVSATFNSYLKEGNGNVECIVHSPTCKTALYAKLRDGYLYLVKPWQAELVITPELSELLFKDMGVTVASSSNPLSVYVDPRGFEMPYKNYKVRDLRLPFARVDIGQLVVRNRGNPENVSELFKLQFDERKLIHVWFAPMDLSVKNGIMSIDRTEVLYNQAQEICYWGQIDLYREYVNMIIGLTAQSLDSALGIVLPPNYVLKVPLRGPYGDVQLDKQAAMSQIAMLIAGRVGSMAPGPWGSLFEAFGEAAKNQSDIPPPKHPFPWEKRTSKAKAQETAPKKHVKSKELLKRLKKLKITQ